MSGSPFDGVPKREDKNEIYNPPEFVHSARTVNLTMSFLVDIHGVIMEYLYWIQ